MTSTKTVVVNRDELESAFDFVSAGAPQEHTATILVATGKIHWRSVSVDVWEDDDEPDENDDAEGYIPVPHKNDLGLGRRLVLRFVEEHLPGD